MLIALRILLHWKGVVRVLGPSHGRPYLSIVSVVVESAVLYAAASVCFLVAFLAESPIQDVLLPILGEIQVRFF